MAPPKKKRTPAQTRDRRAKIAAAVLGAAFLGVAAIQGPKLLKALHPAPPGVMAGPPLSQTSSTQFAAATLASGQLRRFSTFSAKDPFKALVNLAGGAAAASGASGAGAATAGKKLSVVAPVGASGGTATFTENLGGAGALSARTVPAALILYNGKRQIVALGAEFPAKRPMFRLVSLGLKNVRIGLIGGSFADGRTTLALVRNRKVTLADSTTGGTFALRLLRLTTAPAPVAASAGSGAAPATAG